VRLLRLNRREQNDTSLDDEYLQKTYLQKHFQILYQ